MVSYTVPGMKPDSAQTLTGPLPDRLNRQASARPEGKRAGKH
jgi:hypothetical protein